MVKRHCKGNGDESKEEKEKKKKEPCKSAGGEGGVSMSSKCLHLIAGHILSIPPPSFLHNRRGAHCAQSDDGEAVVESTFPLRAEADCLVSGRTWERVKHLGG